MHPSPASRLFQHILKRKHLKNSCHHSHHSSACKLLQHILTWKYQIIARTVLLPADSSTSWRENIFRTSSKVRLNHFHTLIFLSFFLGYMRYKLCSGIMLYSVTMYILISTNAVLSVIDIYRNIQPSFNDEIDTLLTIAMFVPQFIAPFFAWILMRRQQTYLNHWDTFQVIPVKNLCNFDFSSKS